MQCPAKAGPSDIAASVVGTCLLPLLFHQQVPSTLLWWYSIGTPAWRPFEHFAPAALISSSVFADPSPAHFFSFFLFSFFTSLSFYHQSATAKLLHRTTLHI